MKTAIYIRTTALAVILIGTAATAAAQSYSYFYGENIIGSASNYDTIGALPTDFDMEQYNENPLSPTFGNSSGATDSGIQPDAPSFGTTGFSTTVDLGTGWGQSHASPGFNEVITDVSLYLWVSGLSPNLSTTTFQIYDGLGGRSGTLISNIVTLTEPTDENTFVKLTIPSSLWSGGFSIGKSGTSGTILWNTVTEDGLNGAQRPGFSVTTTLVPVPEPAGALLSGFGIFGLILRRRRA